MVTFDSLVNTAARWNITEGVLRAKLEAKRVTELMVVAYLNWARGMSRRSIAASLGLHHSVVCDSLRSLRAKWPHLFIRGECPEEVPKVMDTLSSLTTFDSESGEIELDGWERGIRWALGRSHHRMGGGMS